MNVVLAGNPNAGKTTLFNALTKSRLKTGNWHGVTTSPTKKSANGVNFYDVPGAYGFCAYSMEENSAISTIKSADIIINVVDALTLENSLYFTRDLLSLGKKTVLYLTKTDRLKRRGGSVNIQNLENFLGVPVLCCSPKKLKSMLLNNEINFIIKKREISFDKAYCVGNTALTRVERVIYNKYFACLLFVFCIITMFFVAFYPNMLGAKLNGWCNYLICDRLGLWLSQKISNEVLKSFVCEGIVGGVGGVLAFLPQLAVLYLFLTLLDESGIISALSFVTDGLFERVNLSGRAAFSLISGFGCTAAAIATTRAFTSIRAQKRTVAVLPFIPCGAKLPVFLTFLTPLFENPFPTVCILYFLSLVIAIVFCKFIGGRGEELLSEVTPICIPPIKTASIKLCFYLQSFIIKVTTAVALFCMFSWLLSHFSPELTYCEIDGSMLCAFTKLINPLFYPLGVKDWRISYAIITGFTAKENVAATVSLLIPEGLNLDLPTTLAVCAFMLTCPACVSAFSASVKECGWLFTLKCVAVQLLISLSFGYTTHLIFGMIL